MCLGRTGRFFAFEHFGIVPDMVVLGKGLGGGIFPLAALIVREDLDIAADRALGHYTHEKNPVACAAALAVLECLEEDGLLENARILGEIGIARMQALAAAHPLVGEVRGLGLLMGIELVKDRATREPARDEAERVMYACLARGLNFKVTMGNILTLTPPLTVTREELEQAFDIIDRSLSELHG
jgi:4-aminobutyrate aminotransferase